MLIDTSRPSPNHSPRTKPVHGLVIHATASGATSALFWLTTRISRVSAHYLIRKDGYIWRLVPEDRAAWHAGKSEWPGLPQVDGSLNDCTVGIELENLNTGRDPYPAVQIDAAIGLSRAIIARHQIPLFHLVRHSDIALPRGRKTDPAGLDWASFVAAAYADSAPLEPTARLYRARSLAWVRDAATSKSAHVDTLVRDEPVRVVRIITGQWRPWSSQWAERAEGGFIWLPQLRETSI